MVSSWQQFWPAQGIDSSLLMSSTLVSSWHRFLLAHSNSSIKPILVSSGNNNSKLIVTVLVGSLQQFEPAQGTSSSQLMATFP